MKNRELLLIGALVMVFASMTSPAVASDFTTIDVPGAGSTAALGINDHGDIVGSYVEGGGYRVHGFVLQQGIFTTIDVPGADFTIASGINNRGDIVGSYTFPGSLVYGFVLHEGVFTTINVPGARFRQTFGINDRGDLVGGDFVVHDDIVTRIAVPGAQITQTSGINDRGDILGTYATREDFFLEETRGFVLHQGIFTPINVPCAGLFEGFTGPAGINDHGDIVGSYRGHACVGTFHGFILHEEAFTTVDVPGASFTEATGINNRGDIVGSYGSGAAAHGFLLVQ